jgi:hypothetical protein
MSFVLTPASIARTTAALNDESLRVFVFIVSFKGESDRRNGGVNNLLRENRKKLLCQIPFLAEL